MELLPAADVAEHLIKLMGAKIPSLSELDKRQRAYLAYLQEAWGLQLQFERLGDPNVLLRDGIRTATEAAEKKARNPRDQKNQFKSAGDQLKKSIGAAKKALKEARAARDAAEKARQQADAEERQALRAAAALETRRHLHEVALVDHGARFSAQGSTVQSFVSAQKSDLSTADDAGIAALEKALAIEIKARRKNEKKVARKLPELKRWREVCKRLEAAVMPDGGDLRAGLDAILAPAYEGLDPKQAGPAISEEVERVDGLITAFEGRRDQLSADLDAARLASSEVSMRVPGERMLDAEKALRSAEARLGDDLDHAERSLAKATVAIQAASKSADEDAQQWEGTRGRRQVVREELLRLVKVESLMLANTVQGELTLLESRVDRFLVMVEKAVEELRLLEEETSTLSRRAEGRVAIQEARDAATTAVKEADDALEAVLVSKRADAGVARIEPVETERQELNEAFERNADAALDARAVDARPTVAGLRALAVRVVELTTEEVTDAFASHAQRQVFESAAERALEAAERALILDRDAAAVAVRQRLELLAAFDRGEEGAVPQMVRLADFMESERDAGEEELIRLQESVQTLLDGIGTRLTTMQTTLQSRPWYKSDKSTYGVYLKALTDRHLALTSTSRVRFPSALQQVLTDLEQLDHDATEAARGLAGESEPGHLPLLEDLIGETRTLKKRVARWDLLAKWTPGEHQMLEESCDALLKDIGSETASASRKRLDALRTQLDTVVPEATRIRQRGEALIERAADGLGVLKARKTAFQDFPRVHADLQSRFEQGKALARGQDMQDSAESTLDRAAKELRDLLEGPALLRSSEEALERSDAESEKTRAAWEARVESFKKELRSGLHKAAKAEIDKLLAAALKAFDNGDPDLASEQLAVAERRARYHHAYPDGLKAAAVKRLGDVGSRYRVGVVDFLQELEKVEAWFAELEPDLAGVTSAMASQLKPLKRLFGADAFRTDLQLVMDKNGDTAKRSAARESALARVREYQGRLRGSTILHHLFRHPFADAEPPMPQISAHLDLGKDLTDLERALTIAVDSGATT